MRLTFLPPALETQELAGIRSSRLLPAVSTPVSAVERWLSTARDSNTAVGAAALLLNTSWHGEHGRWNRRHGVQRHWQQQHGSRRLCLYSNVDGAQNTALGYNALPNNTAVKATRRWGPMRCFPITHSTTRLSVMVHSKTTQPSSNNTAAGHSALQNYSGSAGNNTAVGEWCAVQHSNRGSPTRR